VQIGLQFFKLEAFRQSLVATVTDKSYVTLKVIVGRIKGSRSFQHSYMVTMHAYTAGSNFMLLLA